MVLLSVLSMLSKDLDQQNTQISRNTCLENKKYLINTYTNQHKTNYYIN